MRNACGKYEVETNVVDFLAVVAASDRGDSWAAPLVAILATVIVVMVTVAVIILVAHLVRRKARQRSSMQG